MHSCRNFRSLSRREMLGRCATGFGSLALTSLLAQNAPAATAPKASPLAPKPTHFPARIRNVIFLYMDGGPSQVDTFDPKPRLRAEDGKPFAMKKEATQFNNNGNTLGSPWEFQQHGQSGIPVSSLFPHVAQCVDDLAVIRSMTSAFSEHTNANYFLHTGSGLQGRPSMGAWIGYGLGSENANLPGFVVLNGGLIPPGGLDNFNSGFLPASYQGSIFKAGANAVANITPSEASPELQTRKLDLMRRMDQGLIQRVGQIDQLESAIANAELAFRMQSAVPELLQIDGESEATKK
ncbi:MAG: hypothetical protein RLZZ399_2913, partial [Verrucomicrobiota bacterium]